MGSLRNFVNKFKYEVALIGTLDTSSGQPIIPAIGRPNNYVYIRILSGQETGTLTTARNEGSAPIFDTRVRIQKDFQVDEWVIKGVDPKFNLANPFAAIYSVVFHRHFLGSGLDDPVEQRRMIPGRTWSPSGLVINVDPFVYQHNGINRQFPGITNVDISSHVPGGGLQRFLVSTIDPVTNLLNLIDGPTFSSATLPTYIALLSIPTGSNVLSAGIVLVNGITNIPETLILDLRASTSIDVPVVIGPTPSTNKAIATWNGTSGDKLNDNPTATIDTNGNLTVNEYKLHAGVATTLSSDAFTVISGFHILEAQTGTADNLVTINGGSGVQELTIQADADDTITVKHGTGNIFLNGGTDFSLSGDKSLRLFYDGTNWSDIGAGGGGGSSFYQTVQDTGVDQTQRSKLDFVGATITDDAGNDRTIVTLAGGGSNITKTTKTFYQRTVLYDNTLSSAGTWDVSSIDQTYDHLELIFSGRATVSTGGVGVESVVSLNNDSTSSNYTRVQVFGSVGGAVGASNDNIRGLIYIPDSSSLSDRFTDAVSTIQDYTLSKSKVIVSVAGLPLDNLNNQYADLRVVTWKSTAAINRVALAVDNATNTFVTGSRLQIIGIKQEDVVTDISGTGTVQFTQTATVTVSNTSAETTLVGSGVGSTMFAANALNAAGRTVRLKIQGILSDLSVAPGNLTINVKLGSTTLVTTGVVALTAGLTNALWELEVTGTVRTVGSSGTIMTQGVLRITNSLADIAEPLTNGTSIITIDFTSSLVADVTCTFSTASSGNNMTSLTGVLEVLN